LYIDNIVVAVKTIIAMIEITTIVNARFESLIAGYFSTAIKVSAKIINKFTTTLIISALFDIGVRSPKLFILFPIKTPNV
jgi:hypothetical protein